MPHASIGHAGVYAKHRVALPRFDDGKTRGTRMKSLSAARNLDLSSRAFPVFSRSVDHIAAQVPRSFVAWVERSETPGTTPKQSPALGFAALNPGYGPHTSIRVQSCTNAHVTRTMDTRVVVSNGSFPESSRSQRAPATPWSRYFRLFLVEQAFFLVVRIVAAHRAPHGCSLLERSNSSLGAVLQTFMACMPRQCWSLALDVRGLYLYWVRAMPASLRPAASPGLGKFEGLFQGLSAGGNPGRAQNDRVK